MSRFPCQVSGEAIHVAIGNGDRTSMGQTNDSHMESQVDKGKKSCAVGISKESNIGIIERCVGDDRTRNVDAGECSSSSDCKNCDNIGGKECAIEGHRLSLIGGDSQGKAGSEGCREETTLVKNTLDIAYFRKVHRDVVEKLTNLCELWEQKSTTIVIPEDQQEEVLGQIRTTVCQAQLLMRQKLKQYIGLVEQAEHGGGEQPTKPEDLQGFWDMVYFQVEDISKKFQGLDNLEKNNWQVEQTQEPATKRRKKCAATSHATVATKSTLSEKQLAAREKREAALLKIKELKAMAAGKKRQVDEQSTDVQSNGNDPVVELKPPCEDTSVEPLCNMTKTTCTDGTKANSSVQNTMEESLAPLMDFAAQTPNHHTSKTISSISGQASEPGFPEELSPLPTAVLKTPKKGADVPTAQLLSFTPANAMSATPKTMESCEGAFKKMYVAVTPSKKLREAHPELTREDVVMSEARRSVRLAQKHSHTPGRQVTVSSLAELPEDLDFSYCPPSQL